MRHCFLTVVLLLGGCGPTTPPCGPQTCTGCCDASGACQLGAAVTACGALGAQCDTCVGTQTCSLGHCQTVAPCLPKTCASANLNCGEAEDGCGGILACGACPSGSSCGAGGTANVCAPGTCTPRTCASLNAECGRVSDGCAALLSCGTCAVGSTCGVGAPNRCACQPTTCAALNRSCGEVSDGCGGLLSCGTCAAGQSCGGGGTAGVCGTGCAPQSCTALGKDCGAVPDGCGNMLSCGTCSGGSSCGGGGTANVCGATCLLGCPSGATCDSNGVCGGANQSALTLDVRAVTVSGSVRLNGSSPTTGPSCTSSPSSTKDYVVFSNDATGTLVRGDIRCDSANFDFAVTLPPGTYRVTVGGYGPAYSNLPDGVVSVNPALVVSGSTSSLVLNVIAVPVSGSVRLNGSTPTTGASCASSPSSTKDFVTFSNDATGTLVRGDIRCDSANFDFAVTLPPGTYRVTVGGYGPAYSNLPDGVVSVNPALVVSGSTSSLVLNVIAVPVSGSVRLNGSTPTTGASCASSPSSTKDFVTFSNDATGTLVRGDIRCDSANFDFAVTLPPGTYRVTVGGYGPAYSNLPDGVVSVNPALVVSGSTSSLVLNVIAVPVSGSVRLNGSTPTTGASCASSPSSTKDFVTFSNAATGTLVRGDIRCDSANFDFAVTLPPGTYRVTVGGYGPAYSNLPDGVVSVNPALVVSGAVASLMLNVSAVAVRGNLRLNGSTPSTGPSCTSSPSSTKDFVTFSNAATGTLVRGDIRCDSANFDFAVTLPPGLYRVTVGGYGPAYSSLPDGVVGVVSQLRVL